ncbi:MAG TPA: histidine phosphatase family protein [Candidatus Limnocylindrales bacterium]
MTQPEAAPPDRPDEDAGVLQLYLLRHADAGDPAAWSGLDANRPLSGKGRRQARWVGRWLSSMARPPEVVVTSPKVRASETAEIATAGWSNRPLVDERLAGGIELAGLAAVLAELAPTQQRVMLVGHDPDFSELASELLGASITLKKGAIARIDVPRPPRAGSGTLRWLVPPEALSNR